LFAIPIPNGKVWGGNTFFLSQQNNNVTDAIAEYQTNGQLSDPDAAVIPSLSYVPQLHSTGFMVTVFHASGQKPASMDAIFRAGPRAIAASRGVCQKWR